MHCINFVLGINLEFKYLYLYDVDKWNEVLVKIGFFDVVMKSSRNLQTQYHWLL